MTRSSNIFGVLALPISDHLGSNSPELHSELSANCGRAKMMSRRPSQSRFICRLVRLQALSPFYLPERF
jgi:hypothetical protein